MYVAVIVQPKYVARFEKFFVNWGLDSKELSRINLHLDHNFNHLSRNWDINRNVWQLYQQVYTVCLSHFDYFEYNYI